MFCFASLLFKIAEHGIRNSLPNEYVLWYLIFNSFGVDPDLLEGHFHRIAVALLLLIILWLGFLHFLKNK